ncbi:class I SAM-dependent methyltransferase [Kineococcus aurantiacus]|uniref:Trans-aconitate methyltransferase n=1 Tax=Kineococcus aurantiacus TaxID=37633 RepID=A0A7Y9J0E7_9ACTN|nr:methyltransferase [Kineococcus aurantiacus]NYD22208.1 trans-aconitate methyltransferase [Kineococcus aurantiacus]
MSHGHTHPPAHTQAHTHRAGHEDGHRRALDLDALVFGDQLTAVLDTVLAELGDRTPHRVVDLGAGTGTGSRLLRDRLPGADLTAVDNDPGMLTHLRAQGFTALAADLDDGFPDLPGVDLVWASSSLHHVTDPAPLLTGARAALAPGGVLAVVEVEGLPAFTTDPAEDRARTAALAAGWNHHPDWTATLRAAGFTVQRHDVTTTAEPSAAAQEYARLWLERYLHLDGADEGGALTALLAGDLVLSPRATRALWLARAAS